jgi:hypothetical protein
MENDTEINSEPTIQTPAVVPMNQVDAFDDAQEASEGMDNLMEMYEESFKRFAEGEVVTGRIISVDKDHVLVDIGYKSEGQIRIHEFRDENGDIVVKTGDSVEVMVEWWDDENEVVILSKEKAAKVKVWDDIKKAHDNDEVIQGIILARVKGGFSVDVGVQAFESGSYRPPESTYDPTVPPQITITLPVHTAVCPARAAGAFVVEVEDQTFMTGSYRPPVFRGPPGVSAAPPQTTMRLSVHTAV